MINEIINKIPINDEIINQNKIIKITNNLKKY